MCVLMNQKDVCERVLVSPHKCWVMGWVSWSSKDRSRRSRKIERERKKREREREGREEREGGLMIKI